jgi:arylsulfatase A-like enzyme
LFKEGMQYNKTRALLAASALFLAAATHSPEISAQTAQTAVAVAPPESTTVAHNTRAGFLTSHVVVISIDGLRPDAIEKFGASTMQRLMREGSYTLTAQTILPSKTLPSHMSMLTGLDVAGHGVDWNRDMTAIKGHVDVPTIFGLAKAQGFHTAAFFSKPKFHHLEVPSTLDYGRSPKSSMFGLVEGHWAAKRTVGYVGSYLSSATDAPNLLFVHIGEPDYAGHSSGWMSEAYGVAVREADNAVANVLEMADKAFGKGEYTVILTADHGGHGSDHGSNDPLDTTIPWIAWGKNVSAGATLGDKIRTMDTAATALWLLGVELPTALIGTPVLGAFSQAPATVGAGK